MNELTTIVAVVPSVFLVVSATGGATATVTHDPLKVQEFNRLVGAALVLASLVTGNIPVAITTMLSVGVALYATEKVWFA